MTILIGGAPWLFGTSHPEGGATMQPLCQSTLARTCAVLAGMLVLAAPAFAVFPRQVVVIPRQQAIIIPQRIMPQFPIFNSQQFRLVNRPLGGGAQLVTFTSGGV